MSDTAWAPAPTPMRRHREGWWHLFAAGLSLLFGLFCMRWEPLLAFEAAAAVALLVLCAARPFVGLLTTLGLTLGLDQISIATHGPIDLSPFTGYTHFFTNLNTVARVPVYLNFMEVMLVTAGLSWTVRRLRSGDLRWRGGVLALPLALMGLVLFGAIAHGVSAGGDWKIAMWATRALFQLIVTYLLAAHMIERRSQVRALLWTVIGVLLFRALMAWYHLGVVYGFNLGIVDTVTTHEEGIFFASLLVLWMVLHIYRAEPAQRRTLALLLPLFAVAFLGAKRRAAMVALLFALPYLMMILDWRRARRVMIAGAFLTPMLLLYVALFWNSSSMVALPIRLSRSLFVMGEVGRMETSNLYRKVENEILTSRIRENPIIGMGFGRAFVYGGKTVVDQQTTKADSQLAVTTAPIVTYIAHNQILWIWAMSGLIGFVAFWYVITIAVAHGTRLARTLRTPYLKAVAAFVTLLVCMQMVVSYGDQQLTEYRTMVYLGLLLGAMVRLPAIERRESIEGKMS